MEIKIKINGIRASVIDNILVVSSQVPMRILSSAIFNGGLREAKGILNIQVPEELGRDKNDAHWNPQSFVQEQIDRLRLEKDQVVALMTAAKMQNMAVCSKKCGEVTLTILATAGKTVAVTAGEPTVSRNTDLKRIGTINIILLVDGNLNDSAMVDAVKTITEAKTVALRELDLRSQFSGDLATGTLTDSIAVACTKRGQMIQFAGTFTLLGELAGKCVRQTVKEAMYKQEQLKSDRTVIERLSERGFTRERMVSMIEKELGQSDRNRVEEVLEQVERLLLDRKISSLLVAWLRFDEDIKKGLIPYKRKDTVSNTVFKKMVESAFESPRFVERNNEPVTPHILLAIVKKAMEHQM